MVMALTIISFIAILGVLAMSTSLLNIQMRSLNRSSDRNFYYLETALDEIYARVGMISSDVLKDSYADVLGGLYAEETGENAGGVDGLETLGQSGGKTPSRNERANLKFGKQAIDRLLMELNLDLGNLEGDAVLHDGIITDPEVCGDAAETLKKYAETFFKTEAGKAKESGTALSDGTGQTDSTGKMNGTEQTEGTALEGVLDASVAAIVLEQEEQDILGASQEGGKALYYRGLTFQGFCLTYTEYETGIQSSLTVDLRIRVPYVRFTNDGDTLFDYVLVANEGIRMGDGSGSSGILDEDDVNYDQSLKGNIYGGFITIDKTSVQADSRLLTAKGALTIQNQGKLSMGSFGSQGKNGQRKTGKAVEEGDPDKWEPGDPETSKEDEFDDENEEKGTFALDSGNRLNTVWAENIDVVFSSGLSSRNTDFYVQDDMTLKGDENQVKLNGRYYGYGNEGASGEKTYIPSKSSAILLNGKKDTVDLRGLDFLMLAGRSYLNFNLSDKNRGGQQVYPMGESLAVKATQSMYLVPEQSIGLIYGTDPQPKPAGSNPVILPEGVESMEVTVTIPDDIAKIMGTAAGTTVRFTVGGGSSAEITAETGAHVFVIESKNKYYIYYDFSEPDDEKENNRGNEKRSLYFEHYLSENVASFNSYLEQARVTGKTGEGGIYLNEDGQILSSGSLYQVAGNSASGPVSGSDETKGSSEKLFQLFTTREEGLGSSLTWPLLSDKLNRTFVSLQRNLAETDRVSGRGIFQDTSNDAVSIDTNEPAGNYVNFSKIVSGVKALKGDIFLTSSEGESPVSIYLSDGDLEVELNGSEAVIRGGEGSKGILKSGGSASVSGGLIVSAGNVKITGEGSFDGLIIAKGTITITGKAELTANAETYRGLLESLEVSDKGNSAAEEAEDEDKIDRETAAARCFYDYGDADATVLNDYADFVFRENWVRAARRQKGGES